MSYHFALHELLPRHSSSCDQSSTNCKPATAKQTLIIAIVFCVTEFLILLLALWYHGCLCCLSWKKRENRSSTSKYEKMNMPIVMIIPDLECEEYAGGGAEMTQADIGAGRLDVSFGGGSGGVGGGYWSCFRRI